MNKVHPPKADLRREISAWGALVWAYADEHVRAATHCGSEPVALANNGYALVRRAETGIGGGTINGLLDAHADAFAIDNLVGNWFDEWPEWRNGVAVYAERRQLPPRVDAVPRFRIVGPEYNSKGRHREIWRDHGAKDHPFMCPLDVVEGFTERDVVRHAEFLSLFDALLEVMTGIKLERWRIVAVDAVRKAS